MKKQINFGIGFITGRPNVCKIINNYEKAIKEQLKELGTEVNITIYILYDLNYQGTDRIEFYNIFPEVYKNIKIKYITPENILEYKKILMSKYDLTKSDVNLFLGNGYAKARNTILFCAVKNKMDYLLFWDDDEYPIANVLDNQKLIWVKQKNVLQHLKNINNSDITIGYRCGMMNPIPYIEYTNYIKEEDFKNFIEALENEVISWKKINQMRQNTSCISYAEMDIAKGERKVESIEDIGNKNFVLGSGICLNLNNIEKIPAFYNPPQARGEDTFFSCALGEKKAKVMKIPTYHFHDSFLQYTNIMEDKYPENLNEEISLNNTDVEQRFLKATIGWTRYKPLLCYITQKDQYNDIITQSKQKLEQSAKKMNKIFTTCDFSILTSELEKYDNEVYNHYQEYLRVNKLWDDLKKKIR